MKTLSRLFYVLCVALCVPQAFAQAATVNASAVVSWAAPTTDTNGNPLTGANALTEFQVFIDTAPISDTNTTLVPANKAAGASTQISAGKTVPSGSTLYVRVKACNAGGCGPFSPEATKKLDPLPATVPGKPTNVSVLVTVQIAAP